jgi:hypothetical protein
MSRWILTASGVGPRLRSLGSELEGAWISWNDLTIEILAIFSSTLSFRQRSDNVILGEAPAKRSGAEARNEVLLCARMETPKVLVCHFVRTLRSVTMAIYTSPYQLHAVLESLFTLSDLVCFNSCSYVVFKVGQSDIPSYLALFR